METDPKTPAKPSGRKVSRRMILQAQTIHFLSHVKELDSRAFEKWVNEVHAHWLETQNGDPTLEPWFPPAAVAIMFRSVIASLAHQAPHLDEQAKKRVTEVLESLPSEFEKDGQVYSSNFVLGNISHWKTTLAGLLGKSDLRALEIGSFEGLSCVWLLQNLLTDPSSRMTCVDSFDFGGQAVTMDASNLQDRFDRNIEAAGLRDRVEKKSGSSQVVLRTLPLESYDYIYIDGSHLAPDVLEDTILCFRLVKVGGIITFDDYGFQPNARPVERPTIAIDAFLACFAEKVEVIYKGYQLSIRRLS